MTIAPPAPSIATTATRATSLLGRLAARVLRHRKAVLLGWLVVLIAGGVASSHVSSRLSVDFSLPGQPGYETGLRISQTYGNGGVNSSPSILVVTLPGDGQVRAAQQRIAGAFAEVRAANPELRVVDYASTGDRAFLTNNGRSTFAYVFEPLPTTFGADNFATAAQTTLQRALPGDQVGLTGLNQLEAGGDAKGPGVFAETTLGGLGALAVLAFVFASLLAFLPLVIAVVSILATFLVVLALTYLTDVSFIVEFLVALVGLGIAIDYSLLLVTRWREERARGLDNAAAVVRAVETAGRAVLLSGLTVAIGLVSLVVLPVPGLRSTGIGGMLIPLISILVVLTLLPALLGGIGPRVDWPRVRHESHASRAWRLARGVTRRRFWAMGLALGVLVVAIIPVFGLKVGDTSADALSKTGPARMAYNVLARGGVPSGVLTPLEVLTEQSAAGATVAKLRSVPGIASVALPFGRDGSRDGVSDLIAIPRVETVNNETLSSVIATHAALHGDAGVIGVSGLGPIEQDYSHAVFGNFPLMFSIIAIVTFLLLARAFRSIVLAAKAVVLNLVSLAATFGLLTWFWQDGHGSSAIFNIPATGAITFWIPLMVFAFLFGLSMDYEVFILSRVREEYDRSGDTHAAVIEGIGRTGRLVTSAALILFLAFASLASAPNTDIKVLATGLGAGILLDATVVRALLVPALVSVLGKWNWWMPRLCARVLFLPSPAPSPEPALQG